MVCEGELHRWGVISFSWEWCLGEGGIAGVDMGR